MHGATMKNSEIGFKNCLNTDVKWRMVSQGGVFFFPDCCHSDYTASSSKALEFLLFLNVVRTV